MSNIYSNTAGRHARVSSRAGFELENVSRPFRNVPLRHWSSCAFTIRALCCFRAAGSTLMGELWTISMSNIYSNTG